MAEREFEALKERIAGKRDEFRRVSCINATVPLSKISNLSDDLCSSCKFSYNGEDRVVIGTLDLNQCLRLPDEIVGKKPEGIRADFARAYLSNVCVAAELHRNGLGYAVIAKSKLVAQEWGKNSDSPPNLSVNLLVFLYSTFFSFFRTFLFSFKYRLDEAFLCEKCSVQHK